MSDYPNYIADTNPFSLAGPPKWFRRQLWDYDPSLVIVPSRQDFCYRLAQRRPLKLPENVINDILKEQRDAQMLASYGLVPVTTILATVRWDSPLFFSMLTDMAPWRNGGAVKYEQKVLEQDRKEWLAKRHKVDEHLTHLAKDAWLHYNKHIGLRSNSFEVGKKKASTSKAPAVIIPNAAKEYKPIITSGWGDTLKKR